MNETVILLATNLANPRYFSEFITSISKQTDQNFDVFWSEDSRDRNEIEKIKKFIGRDSRFVQIPGLNQGPTMNFINLLTQAEGYKNYFFADQDDIWLPRRIETQVIEMKKHRSSPEAPYGIFFTHIL